MGVTFNDIDDDCGICPFGKLGCAGLTNNGNGPAYPPCAELDPDTDIDDYLEKMEELRKKKEEQRKQETAKKADDEVKKRMKKRRRQYSDQYCRKELEELKELNKAKRFLDTTICNGEITLKFAEAMEEVGIPMGNPDKTKDMLDMAERTHAHVMTDIEDVKSRLAKKRQEVMSSEAYKNIQ